MSTQDHAIIYLEPGDGDMFTGREWCEDDPWSGRKDDYDGAKATKYVRADISDGLLSALRLLLKEMELSGNAGATDYGWPKAVAESRAAIAKAESAR